MVNSNCRSALAAVAPAATRSKPSHERPRCGEMAVSQRVNLTGMPSTVGLGVELVLKASAKTEDCDRSGDGVLMEVGRREDGRVEVFKFRTT